MKVSLTADCRIELPQIKEPRKRLRYELGSDEMKVEFGFEKQPRCEVEKSIVNQDGSPLGEPFYFVESAQNSGLTDLLLV